MGDFSVECAAVRGAYVPQSGEEPLATRAPLVSLAVGDPPDAAHKLRGGALVLTSRRIVFEEALAAGAGDGDHARQWSLAQVAAGGAAPAAEPHGMLALVQTPKLVVRVGAPPSLGGKGTGAGAAGGQTRLLRFSFGAPGGVALRDAVLAALQAQLRRAAEEAARLAAARDTARREEDGAFGELEASMAEVARTAEDYARFVREYEVKKAAQVGGGDGADKALERLRNASDLLGATGAADGVSRETAGRGYMEALARELAKTLSLCGVCYSEIAPPAGAGASTGTGAGVGVGAGTGAGAGGGAQVAARCMCLANAARTAANMAARAAARTAAPLAPRSAAAVRGGRSQLEASGGMLLLSEVFCIYNRARGLDPVSPQELLEAAGLLAGLPELGLSLLALAPEEFDAPPGSGVLRVLRRSDFSDAAMQAKMEALLRGAAGAAPPPPYLTAADLAQRWSMPLQLARRHLVLAERSGLLCRDDSLAGLRFFANDFAVLAEADAERLRAAEGAGNCRLAALLAAGAGPGGSCHCRGAAR